MLVKPVYRTVVASMNKLNSSGDTIIEVLIAIAVASFVVAGSYAVVNRSLRETRQSQEHAEALLIANTQVEILNHYIKTTPTAILESSLYAPGLTRFHCFNPVTAQIEQLNQIVSLPDSNASHYNDPFVPDPDCDTIGSVGYRMAFEYLAGDTSTHSDDRYSVYVNWASINSSADDQVKVVYKAGL